MAKYVLYVKHLLLRHGNMEKIETYLRDVALRLGEAVRLPEAVAPPGTRWKRQAVDEITRVLEETDCVEQGIRIAALFLMRDWEPRRFVSDKALTYAVVRRWRAQTSLAVGGYWNDKLGKVVSWYRPLPPRVVEALGTLLTAAYSRFATRVCLADQQSKTQQIARQEHLEEGFKASRVCASKDCGERMPFDRSLLARWCSYRCANREAKRRAAAKKRAKALAN